MSTRLMKATLLSVAGLLSGPVVAANESGFELSVGSVVSRMDGLFSGARSADLTRVNDRASGWSVAGGWHFNRNFAVDLEYTDHGRFQGFNVCPPDLLCIAANVPESVKAQTVALSLLGEMQISNDWSMFGRLGYADTELNRQRAGDTDDQAAVVGAGLRWSYRPQASVALEYRTEAADIERLGLNFSYRF